MAILRDRRFSGGPSGGNDFPTLNDKIHGFQDFRLNKRKELYTSDYIYLYDYTRDDDDDSVDKEIGINKCKHLIHTPEYLDDHKDEHHRYYQGEDDELLDIIEGDVELSEDILDILLGDDNV